MDAIQQSLNVMMEAFHKRLDSIEGQLPGTTPVPSGGLAEEFANFKAFVVASFRAIQGQISLLAQQVDQAETHSRRKILLLHGLPEDLNEDTSKVLAATLVEQLKLAKFSVADISRCHRMGRAATGRPRPVLFKLRDVTVREQIWSVKTALKNTGLTLSEFLTKTRHDLFMSARRVLGISRCWTRQGHVYALGPDGARRRINCQDDLAGMVDVASATKSQAAGSSKTAAPVSKVKEVVLKPKRDRIAPVKK